MKYHRLHIDTDGTKDNYDAISKVLGIQLPDPIPVGKFDDNPFDLWTYEVNVPDEDPYYDFINKFLDIIEPKYTDLEKLGVTKDKIIFWLVYEYYAQCSMSFDPQEMKRLGESGIALNIDCYSRTEEEEKI